MGPKVHKKFTNRKLKLSGREEREKNGGGGSVLGLSLQVWRLGWALTLSKTSAVFQGHVR